MGFLFASEKVTLYKDGDGKLHSQPFCWQALHKIEMDPHEVVGEPRPACTECAGWESTKFGVNLEKFFFCKLALEKENDLMGSFEEIIASLEPWRNGVNPVMENSHDLHDYPIQAQKALLNRARSSLDTLPVDSLITGLAAKKFAAEVCFDEAVIFTRWVESLGLFQKPYTYEPAVSRFTQKLQADIHSSPAVLLAVQVYNPASFRSSSLSNEALLLSWRNLSPCQHEGVAIFHAPLLVAESIKETARPDTVEFTNAWESDPMVLESLKVLLKDLGIHSLPESLRSARLLTR